MIPDITGDGKPEIGTNLEATFFANGQNTSAYIVSSQVYENLSPALNDINLDTNHFTRFTRDGSIDPLTTSISAKTSTSSVDILIAETTENRITMFKVANSVDSDTLKGDVDPDDASNISIRYDFNIPGRHIDAELIEDINGDGQNDIFVRFIASGPVPFDSNTGDPLYDIEQQRFGIIFGKQSETSTQQIKTDDLDINLIFNAKRLVSERKVYVTTLQNLDGDGARELMISAPGYDKPGPGLGEGEGANGIIWLLRSGALDGPQSRTIDLDNITEAQGRALDSTLAVSNSDDASNANLGAFLSIIGDYDGDGTHTLAFLEDGVNQQDTGGLYIIDGDDFFGLPVHASLSDFYSAGGRRILTNQQNLSVVNDINGDGLVEIAGQTGATLTLSFMDGNDLKNILGGNESRITTALTPIFNFETSEFQTFEAFAPVQHNAGTDSYVFGLAGLDISPASNTGSIVLVKGADVQSALADNYDRLALDFSSK